VHFYHCYDEVRTADMAMSFKAITYRGCLVKLYHLYNAAESVYLK
jgi:hypothetical protein